MNIGLKRLVKWSRSIRPSTRYIYINPLRLWITDDLFITSFTNLTHFLSPKIIKISLEFQILNSKLTSPLSSRVASLLFRYLLLFFKTSIQLFLRPLSEKKNILRSERRHYSLQTNWRIWSYLNHWWDLPRRFWRTVQRRNHWRHKVQYTQCFWQI